MDDEEEFDLFLNSAKSVYEFFSGLGTTTTTTNSSSINEEVQIEDHSTLTRVKVANVNDDEVFYDALSDSVVVKVAQPPTDDPKVDSESVSFVQKQLTS